MRRAEVKRKRRGSVDGRWRVESFERGKRERRGAKGRGDARAVRKERKRQRETMMGQHAHPFERRCKD
jgi:hypothetical protein